MENNISEKYAVYTVGADGKNTLSVVVDTPEQAKAELEKLKVNSACLKINKSKVENFGKDGEKTIESVEIECWKKENEAAEKLSSFQKSADATPLAASGEDGNPIITPAVSVVPPVVVKESALKKNLNSFLNYYCGDGDLMGIGYNFFPAAEIKIEETATSLDSGLQQSPSLSQADSVKPDDSKIEKLTEEVSGLKEKIDELIDEKKDDKKEEDADEN